MYVSCKIWNTCTWIQNLIVGYHLAKSHILKSSRKQTFYRPNTIFGVPRISLISGGSRISRRGGVDPLGGVDLRCGCFLPKMYAKTKELGPVGGMHWACPLDLPMLIVRINTLYTARQLCLCCTTAIL